MKEYTFEKGIAIEEFLKRYGSQVKNKHILYAVSNNNKNDNRVFKVGKAFDGSKRLLDYQHYYGKNDKKNLQAGAKVYKVQVYEKRKTGMQGEAKVNVAEKNLRKAVKESQAVKKATGRGAEYVEGSFAKINMLMESSKVKNPTVKNSDQKVRRATRFKAEKYCKEWGYR